MYTSAKNPSSCRFKVLHFALHKFYYQKKILFLNTKMVAGKTVQYLHYYNCVNAIPTYKDWKDLEESRLGRVY